MHVCPDTHSNQFIREPEAFLTFTQMGHLYIPTDGQPENIMPPAMAVTGVEASWVRYVLLSTASGSVLHKCKDDS